MKINMKTLVLTVCLFLICGVGFCGQKLRSADVPALHPYRLFGEQHVTDWFTFMMGAGASARRGRSVYDRYVDKWDKIRGDFAAGRIDSMEYNRLREELWKEYAVYNVMTPHTKEEQDIDVRVTILGKKAGCVVFLLNMNERSDLTSKLLHEIGRIFRDDLDKFKDPASIRWGSLEPSVERVEKYVDGLFFRFFSE